MKQKRQILLAFILPAIVALLTVAVFLESSNRHLAIERWSVEHRALVHGVGEAIEERLNEVRGLLEYAARQDSFKQLTATRSVDPALNGVPAHVEAQKRQMLQSLLTQMPTLSIAFIALPDGEMYLAQPYEIQRSLQKHNLADRAYFQEATRTRQAAVSNGLLTVDGRLSVVIDLPLLDAAQNIYAHLGVVVSLKNLSALLSPERVAPFDQALLVDRQNRLLAHTWPDEVILEVQRAPFAHPLLEASDQASDDKARFLEFSDRDRRHWLGFALRLDNGWTLLVQREVDSALSEYSAATRRSTALVAAILIVTGGIGLLIAFVIANRWEEASQQVIRAHDELELRVAERTAELAASQERLARSSDFYLSVLENFPALIWRSGLDAKCDYFNRTWLEFTGRPLSEELGDGWAEGIHPDDLERCVDTYIQNFEQRTPFEMEYRLRHHSGEYRWIIDMGHPFHGIQGEFIGFLGACFDASERHAAAERLRLAASVFSHAREGILLTDAETNILEVNDAFCEITGYSRAEVVGQRPGMLKASRLHNQDFYQDMWVALREHGYWQGEIWNRKKSGEVYAELLTISTVRDTSGAIANYVGIFADITLQKEHEQRLEHLAHYDPLTGLPNRTLLSDRLHMAIAQAQRGQQQLAICMLDLDGFKQVNDRFGHATGDQLLVAFTHRLNDELRQTDTVARLGGDEFVILLNELDSVEQCIEIVQRIILVACQAYHLGEEATVDGISASIGITLYPDDGADPDQLLRHADQAMYIAKQTGGNRYFMFDPLKDLSIRREISQLERLGEALDHGEFELFYQPKVDMRRGQPIGAEALIRWRHPERGLVAPGEFLPLIEQHALAIPLGEWVIGTALRQMEAWRRQGLALRISVNISPRHLQQADFATMLAGQLALHPDVPPECLELEILESAALEDTRHASEVIAACRRMGVHFSLDDFGTGYSSLLYLKLLPADTLKIDQSFIRNMLDDSNDLAIVKGVIGLAEAFNRDVIAEGVETEDHGSELLKLGCVKGQGYGIARPMPAGEFPAWVERWRPPASWQAIR